jgi:hypothetical protein
MNEVVGGCEMEGGQGLDSGSYEGVLARNT